MISLIMVMLYIDDPAVIYLFVSLSICLSAFLSICVFFFLNMYLSIYLSIYLPLFVYVRAFYLPFNRSCSSIFIWVIFLSSGLLSYLSICLSISLSAHIPPSVRLARCCHNLSVLITVIWHDSIPYILHITRYMSCLYLNYHNIVIMYF